MDASDPAGPVIALVLFVLVTGVVVLHGQRPSNAVTRRLEPQEAGRPWSGLGPIRGLAARVRAREQSRRRSSELRRALPLVAELTRMAVTAGFPPAGALRHVAPWVSGVAGAELRRVVADVDGGLALYEALDDLRDRAVEFRGLARVLQASSDLGTEVGSAVERVARDEREALRRSAEARARTVPVRLLFPLVFLVLPAFVLLGIVPGFLAGSAG